MQCSTYAAWAFRAPLQPGIDSDLEHTGAALHHKYKNGLALLWLNLPSRDHMPLSITAKRSTITFWFSLSVSLCMTPTTFGSDSKRILIPYKPQENKWLHSDEIPSRSSHWWKGCARNHAGLRTFGGRSCCEPKPRELALYILLTMKAFRNLNFGYFCKRQKRTVSLHPYLWTLLFFIFVQDQILA